MSVKECLNVNVHQKKTVHDTNVTGHNYIERSYLTIVCKHEEHGL